MTGPHGNGPMGRQDDLAALAALDLALDELAAGDVLASPIGGEAAILAAVAAELRTAVPAPPPATAERGRAAFLARAAQLQGTPATAEPPPPATASPLARWRRRLPVRVAALAAALVVFAAVPVAVARQAQPGTALWPVRQVGQQLRVRLADDPARRAHLRLNIAEEYLAAGTGAGEERREAMADRAGDLIKDVLDQLRDVAGSRAAAERARAERLLLAVRALEHGDDRSGPGPGSGSGSGEDHSGSGGGGDDPGDGSGKGSSGGDDHSRQDGGSGSGPKRGSSGSGSGSGSGTSGSNRSGDD